MLIFDEPTQGVDVHGRMEIHILIRNARAAGNTVLLASSDLDELLELSDTVVTLLHGHVVSVSPSASTLATRVLAEIPHEALEPVVNP